MRTLSTTLAAEQKKHIAEPVAQVMIDDRHIGVARPRWSLLVNEPTVADGPSVVAGAYDGAIIRARVDPAEGKLYVQRVSDPASTAQWASWTLLESGVAAASQIALAWDGNTIQALFFVAGDGRTIKMRQSTDNGQTWQSAETAATLEAGHVCRSLAASLNSGLGTLYCFYSDEAGSQTHIYSTQRAESGGAWSTPQSWGRSPAGVAFGLAVEGRGVQFSVAACLDDCLDTFCVAPASLGAWPGPTEVLHSDTNSVSYRWPSIGIGVGHHYCIFFIEDRDGAARLHHVITANWDDISMFARPYQALAAYGVGVTTDLAYHYLCTSRSVYRAKRWQPDASQRVDVSADVLAVRLSEHRDRPGELALALRNDGGRYSGAGTALDQPILPGSQVSVRLGYRTPAGDEVSFYRPYWITRIERRRTTAARAAVSTLVLTATDGWGILERARACQTYTWTGCTVQTILTALLAGFGFYVTGDGASVWASSVSRFAVNPGVSLGEAVRRLLRLAGGDLIFRSDAEWESLWPSAVAHLAAAGEAGAYSFGSDHPIIAASNGLNEQATTHVIVLGDGQATGEAVDWDAVELGNQDRTALVIDRRLATALECTTRAANELATWQQAAASGWLMVQPNVGQEILDVITIDDAAAGFDNGQRLVIDNEITLDREKNVFQQRLTLARAEGGG